MTIGLILLATFLLNECLGQIIDIGEIWELRCPQGCSCEIQRFADLPVHRWIRSNDDQDFIEETDYVSRQPFDAEFLKVATCVIAENPDDILRKLPSDIQVFTILESGRNSKTLSSRSFERFTELISLEIQGLDLTMNSSISQEGGINLSIDALIPVGVTLLYLNLERVKLTSDAPNRNKANLVVKPATANVHGNVDNHTYEPDGTAKQNAGHRLIFLSQQNNGENEDMEILPYDIYKQEIEGYRENGLFAGLASLTYLRVYDCSLTDVTWHMFDGLDSLIYLSLERNSLKFIPEFCFYGTPNLRRLSLARNQLLSLRSVDLAGLLKLEDLDLRGNNLTFLSELSFPPFPTLRHADFTENPLDSVFPSTFEIMNTTLKLYLGGNGSKLQLQKNSFLGLRRLETLHLYNLEVPLLERFVLQGMPALLELRMRGNISSIDFDAFVDLPRLRELDLSECHLKSISMDAFYGLEHVRRIDLSNNELEYVPPGLFSLQQQKKLKEIVLSRNRLTNLPLDFFKLLRSSNKQMQVIRLDGNPWDCSCSMITWSPQLVSRVRETAPRCSTPKRLRNWGVFHALRKGGLQCKTSRRKRARKFTSIPKNYEDNNVIS